MLNRRGHDSLLSGAPLQQRDASVASERAAQYHTTVRQSANTTAAAYPVLQSAPGCGATQENKVNNSALINLKNKTNALSQYSEVKNPKVDLENFQDLSRWCQKPLKLSKMDVQLDTDELNTPVIELREPFGYNVENNTVIGDGLSLLDIIEPTPDLFSEGLHIKSEYDPIAEQTTTALPLAETLINFNNLNNNYASEAFGEYYPKFSLGFENGDGKSKPVQSAVYGSSQISTNNSNTNTDYGFTCDENIQMFSPPPGLEENNFKGEYVNLRSSLDEYRSPVSTPTTVNVPEATPCADREDVEVFDTVNNFSDILLDLKDSRYAVLQNVVPKDSNKKNLRLDLSNLFSFDNKYEVLDTPEVIQTAMSFDKDMSFNLIDFITEEVSNSSTNQADPADTISSNFSPSNSSHCTEEPLSPVSPVSTISRTSGKRRKIGSDDEDYVPFSKKIKTAGKKITGNGYVVKQTKRGRPPKVPSVSPSGYEDPDGSRYRELRDKNNEASRRSRINRKLREQKMEVEAQELEEVNGKLKVQVEQLEKMVLRMRTNLMEILLKSK